MKFCGIAAIARNNGLGIKNKLPWVIPDELKRFAKLTIGNKNNAVVMGRKTWESLPKQPLSFRDNYIISNNKNYTLINNKNTTLFVSLDQCIKHIHMKNYETCWVIGGTSIYEQFLKRNILHEFYITRIHKKYQCDVFLPKFSKNWHLSQVEYSETLLYDKYNNSLWVEYEKWINCNQNMDYL